MLKACKREHLLILKAANIGNQYRGCFSTTGQKTRKEPFELFSAIRFSYANVNNCCYRVRTLYKFNAIHFSMRTLLTPVVPPIIPITTLAAPLL